MKIKKIWHFEFYQSKIVIKPIHGQISNMLMLKIWISNVFYLPKIVPGQNRFYNSLSQNTPKIKTLFSARLEVSTLLYLLHRDKFIYKDLFRETVRKWRSVCLSQVSALKKFFCTAKKNRKKITFVHIRNENSHNYLI